MERSRPPPLQEEDPDEHVPEGRELDSLKRDQATAGEPKDDERPSEASESELASSGLLRCPYCHDGIEANALVSRCASCKVHHHVSCFAEHQGCSTFGCEATHGQTVRAPGRRPQRSCAECKQGLTSQMLSTSCRCGRRLDAACYAELGRCGASCSVVRLDLMTGAERDLRSARTNLWVFGLLGLGFLLVGAVLLLGAGVAVVDAGDRWRDDLRGSAWIGAFFGSGFFLAVGALLTWSGFTWRRRSRSIQPPEPLSGSQLKTEKPQ